MAQAVQSCEPRTHSLLLPSTLPTTCPDHQQKTASQILKQRKKLLLEDVQSWWAHTLSHLNRVFNLFINVYFIGEFLKKSVQAGHIYGHLSTMNYILLLTCSEWNRFLSLYSDLIIGKSGKNLRLKASLLSGINRD